VLLLSGYQSYGEPLEQSGISFSIFYPCHTEEDDQKMQGFCVADSFEKGLNVVLVCEQGGCSAKTADRFMDEDWPGGHEVKATRLTGTENCFAVDDITKLSPIAVVGVDPSAVRVVEPKTDESPLSKEIESRARKIASSEYQRNFRNPEGSVVDVADSPPDVFSVGNTAFLLFKCSDEFYNQDGLPVLVLNNDAFLLEGACAVRSPFFFSVKEKLYVAYWATVACCGCGDSNFFVYDLSGESPKLVCHNSDFST